MSLLALDDVGKNFGGLVVVKNLSFTVEAGQRVALIGPNGAGKSTVFNLITGVYPLTSGRVLFDGVDITHLPMRRRIGLGVARSFQNIRLMGHLSVVENIMLGQQPKAGGLAALLTPYRLMPRHRWIEEARAALDEAGLGAYADLSVDSLPYGVRKRVDLLRAVVANPKMLLLDEPAAGLNERETEDLHDALMAIAAKGVTLVVVEHDMHFVDRLCERVVVINFGEKIAEGTMAEVRASPLVREAYLGGDATVGAGHA
ncbi:MAG: ABC transporter ATP-binding protein [Rhodospirillales bacterium]|nr:ABC transporter ATP-binding protein [Rhodospirillales bacterium]